MKAAVLHQAGEPPRKSWQEKLADDKDLPKVFRLTGKAKPNGERDRW